MAREEQSMSTTDKSVSGLAPCPFCGASPHRGPMKADSCQLRGEQLQRYSIWCPHLCARKTEPTEAVAVAAWNHRAPEPPAEGVEPVAWQFRYNGKTYLSPDKSFAMKGVDPTPLYLASPTYREGELSGVEKAAKEWREAFAIVSAPGAAPTATDWLTLAEAETKLAAVVAALAKET